MAVPSTSLPTEPETHTAMADLVPRLKSAFLALSLALAGCTAGAPPPASPATAAAADRREPVTILISIDGFRPDYLERGVTPNLNALAAAGARADMRPSFPTKTFPNHYTLVTGLRPDRHGMIENYVEDPRRPGVRFDKKDPKQAFDPFWWDAAEPLWITAEKQGLRTATMLWPGSEVAFSGRRPTYWRRYAERLDDEARLRGALDWLRLPEASRPRFVAVYLEKVDQAGHDYGPDSPETTRAIGAVDAQIGAFRRELATLAPQADVVVVSDHGMEATSRDRVVRIDAMVGAQSIHVVSDGTFMSFAARPGEERRVEALLLGRHDHFQCWRKGNLPARLHYGTNPRVQPIFCLADRGWVLLAREPGQAFDVGNHGYDNRDPDMRALFIAAGPDILRDRRVPMFDNVDVYPFLARLIGVRARPGDGKGATLGRLLSSGR